MIAEKMKIAVLCHPLAGTGRAVILAREIVSLLDNKQIEAQLFSGEWPAHFDGFSHVYIVGGDGSLHHFVNQYPQIKLPLALFAGGTGNDFHWLLYGSLKLEEQLDIVLSANPHPIDLATCNEHYFINGAGVGFEGAVAKALIGKKKRPGKTTFFITVLKKIFNYRSRYYHLITKERELADRNLFIDISNGRRAGGGFYIAPTASADDGMLDIVIAAAMPPWKRLYYLPQIEKGKHLHLSVIKHFQSQAIKIESDSLIQYHLDGEYYEAAALAITILPGQLKFCF